MGTGIELFAICPNHLFFVLNRAGIWVLQSKKIVYTKIQLPEAAEQTQHITRNKKTQKTILTNLQIRTIVKALVEEQILFQVGVSSQVSKTSKKFLEKKFMCKGGMIG